MTLRVLERLVVVTVKPPDADDPNWLVSAPAIHYHAQGPTCARALELFDEGLDEAVRFAAHESLVQHQ